MMKLRVNLLVFICVGSLFVQGQSMDIAYVDNRFVDVKGIPVTGEYNFSTASIAENANVRISHGILTGTAIFYYANGKVKEIAHYKSGKKHGEWYQFNEEGKLIVQAKYANNKKEGYWKVWDDHGNLRLRMKYRNDKKTGLWKSWNNKGQLQQKVRY